MPRLSRPVAHQEGGFTEPSPPPTGGHLPQRGRRDLAFCKLSAAHILGSPLGGAVAVRRLRGQPASAPHLSVSPRRRLYQRAAHAWGGVTGKLGGNLRGIEDAIKKPPARVSYGKQSTGLFSYFPALAGAIRPWDAVPHPASFLSRKLGKELHPPTARTCASLLMSTSEASCHGRELTAQALGPTFVLYSNLFPPHLQGPGGI